MGKVVLRVLRKTAGITFTACFILAILSGCKKSDKALAGLSGFGEEHLKPANHPMDKVHGTPPWSTLTSVNRTDLPPLSGTNTLLATGDVLGTEEPEIVVADTSSVCVFSLQGKPITQRTYKDKNIRPAFLYDADRDGKLDILCGSTSSGDLSIRMINGFGNVVRKFSVSSEEKTYTSLLPRFVYNGSLFVVAKEGWIDSPRGVLAFTFPDFSTRWLFSLPSNPVELCVRFTEKGDEVLTISHITRHTGMYPRLGTFDHKLKPGDASIRLFQTNSAGDIINYRQIMPAKNHIWNRNPEYSGEGIKNITFQAPLAGIGLFYPLGTSCTDPFILIQNVFEDDPAAPYFFVHCVTGYASDTDISTGIESLRGELNPQMESPPGKNSAGRIVSSAGPFPGRFTDLRLLPSDRGANNADGDCRRFTDWDIVLLSRPSESEATMELTLLSPDLRMISRKAFNGTAACLGPVLRGPSQKGGKEITRFFFAAADRLYVLDSLLREINSLKADNPRALRYWERENKRLLISAGKSLEIWELKGR